MKTKKFLTLLLSIILILSLSACSSEVQDTDDKSENASDNYDNKESDQSDTDDQDEDSDSDANDNNENTENDSDDIDVESNSQNDEIDSDEDEDNNASSDSILCDIEEAVICDTDSITIIAKDLKCIDSENYIFELTLSYENKSDDEYSVSFVSHGVNNLKTTEVLGSQWISLPPSETAENITELKLKLEDQEFEEIGVIDLDITFYNFEDESLEYVSTKLETNYINSFNPTEITEENLIYSDEEIRVGLLELEFDLDSKMFPEVVFLLLIENITDNEVLDSSQIQTSLVVNDTEYELGRIDPIQANTTYFISLSTVLGGTPDFPAEKLTLILSYSDNSIEIDLDIPESAK